MYTNITRKVRVTTALLLAAGTGSRLYPLTQCEPKCLTLVNGTSILERMVSSLDDHGFKRLVIVTGHLEDCIRRFLGNRFGHMQIHYVFSPLYKTTNNIYSLWMARNVIKEPFLLLESDLVFDQSLLNDMLYPDRIAVAKMQPWMNGTCVTLNPLQRVEQFIVGKKKIVGQQPYKTVNIYSLSKESWEKITRKLDERITNGCVNEYYETVFADLVDEGRLAFKGVTFDHKPWYEIDTLADLAEAEQLFSTNQHQAMQVMHAAR